jgi:glycerophosphoryl diester phosphodiesterase
MQVDQRKVIITAHRGASGMAPENTLAAIKKAMELGADWSEVDVHLSKDGEVILLHDESMSRTANRKGKVWEFTLEELKKLDAGSWYSPLYAGEPLPTLREVIRLVKGRMKLNIEIKISGSEADIVEKVLDIIQQEGFSRDCLITSFDRETVESVLKIAPQLKTGLILAMRNSDNILDGAWKVLSCHHAVIDKDFIDKAHKAGREIHAWTVNSKEMMRQLIEIGVDGIITNYPDRLKEILRR